MKTENLEKAYASAKILTCEIRKAHTDAINSENQFAEISIFDIIEASVNLEQKLRRLVDAARGEYRE